MEKDILNYALEHGMIDLSYISNQVEMTKRERILKNHQFAVWKGGDNKWHTYLPDADKGRVHRKRNTKEEIDNVIIEYYTQEEKEKKAQEHKRLEDEYRFSASFQKWREAQISYGIDPNTVARYDTDYVRFFKGTDFEKMDIRDMTEDDISLFVIERIKSLDLIERAGKALWGYIAGVFRIACIKRRISANPCLYVDTKKFKRFYHSEPKRTAPRTFTDKEVDALLEKINQDHMERPNYIPSYALELAIFTGMRLGELAALKWSDILFDPNRLIIRHAEKVNRQTNERTVSQTKNKKEREFPLSDELISFFGNLKKIQEEYGYQSEYVFANENGRIQTYVIANCLRRRCVNLGIPVRGIHAFRRTLNSKLRCAGMSPVVAASLLGHTPEVNDKHYTYDVSDYSYKQGMLSSVFSKAETQKEAV